MSDNTKREMTPELLDTHMMVIERLSKMFSDVIDKDLPYEDYGDIIESVLDCANGELEDWKVCKSYDEIAKRQRDFCMEKEPDFVKQVEGMFGGDFSFDINKVEDEEQN